MLSELIVHRVALKRIKLMGSIDVLVHDFIILLLKLFRVMIVAVLNLLISHQVVTLKLLHACLVLLLELLALLVVVLDHFLVLYMEIMELFVHVFDGHLNLVNSSCVAAAVIFVMCLGVLSEVFFVELFRVFIDSLVLLDMLLVVVVASVSTKAQVDDVDRLVVNEDVNVEDGASEHHHVVSEQVQVDLRPS